MKISKKTFNQLVLLMLIAAALVLAITHTTDIIKGMIKCLNIITPFLVGGGIAFVFNIPMHVFETRLLSGLDGPGSSRFRRPLSLVLTILLVTAIIVLMVVIIVPNLSSTFADLAKQVPLFLASLVDWLSSHNLPLLGKETDIMKGIISHWNMISNNIIGFITSGAGTFVTSTISVVTSLFGIVVNAVIAFIFAIYLLFAKESLQVQIQKLMKAYLPDKFSRRVNKVCRLLNTNFSNFVTGQCLDAMILGSIFIVVLLICRMPYAVMIGVIIAFTALIPVVGAFIGCAFGALLILMVSPVKALIFIIIFLVVQQLEGNLIYPRVVGNSVGLPAIWVLVAIAVGGSLFGVIGMLTFIPLSSTAYTLLREDVYKRISLK